MNKILLVIAFSLGIIAVSISSEENTTFFNNQQNIKVKKDDKVDNLELENYIIGVVAAEMPASFHEEALKAQAIASRTYAIYKINSSKEDYDILASVSNQGYITEGEMKAKWLDEYEKYYNKIKEAVISTKGKILKYNGDVVEAYYFAMSNGYTEESSLVFSEEKDYLKSVKSIYDNSSINNFKKEVIIEKNKFCAKLVLDCNEIIINNIERSNTNRVNTITINNKTFKGTEFRKLLDLRSTDFAIEITDFIKITTLGYGHGVGMSQYGANGMANNGYKYDEILKYYYKDVEISDL